MTEKNDFTNRCYSCEHRADAVGSQHAACSNWRANVIGSPHGIANGWFLWPFDFDPVWLTSCDGFKEKETE